MGGTGVTLTINAGVLGTAALEVIGTLPGNSAIIINSSATTGAQTATFTATNKPGTATSSPAGWLPITCDGVQYYTPIWHGNNFTPYAANPTAVGEIIVGSSVTFGGNGLTTAVGTATPGNWFSPTTVGIGAGYYINITRTGGTTGVNFSAAQGAWTNITSGGLSISTTGGTGTVTGTYQLSSSVSGSPIVASGTIQLTKFSAQHTYTSGSGTETIPSGATTLTIEVWSGMSGGGGGDNTSGWGGGGGPGPSYSRSVFTVSGNNGQTMTYTVGAAGAGGPNGTGGASGDNGSAGGSSSVSSGTFTLTTLTCTAGGVGGGGQSGSGGTAGTASSATGGNTVNSNGTAGGVGTHNGASGGGTAGTNSATPLYSGSPTNLGLNVGGAPGAGAGPCSTGIISFNYS
jgi:hypothetical protein